MGFVYMNRAVDYYLHLIRIYIYYKHKDKKILDRFNMAGRQAGSCWGPQS